MMHVHMSSAMVCNLVHRTFKSPQWVLPYNAETRCRCTEITLSDTSCFYIDEGAVDSEDYLFADDPIPFLWEKRRGGKTLREWMGCPIGKYITKLNTGCIKKIHSENNCLADAPCCNINGYYGNTEAYCDGINLYREFSVTSEVSIIWRS